jgi:hypothetical protein
LLWFSISHPLHNIETMAMFLLSKRSMTAMHHQTPS